MRREDSFCCLGVLCELLVKKDKEFLVTREKHNDCYYYDYGDGNDESGHLPGLLRMDLGISEDEESTLIHLNDEDRLTFPEIADYIEENL